MRKAETWAKSYDRWLDWSGTGAGILQEVQGESLLRTVLTVDNKEVHKTMSVSIFVAKDLSNRSVCMTIPGNQAEFQLKLVCDFHDHQEKLR
jgi:hypothetical protein